MGIDVSGDYTYVIMESRQTWRLDLSGEIDVIGRVDMSKIDTIEFICTEYVIVEYM